MSKNESHEERLDRELIELLNELRVVLPGVQVLFAFLLTVPFTNRFQRITDTQEFIFFATFLLTLVATGLLIAPSAYHRLRWRRHDKERIVLTSHRLVIAGMGTLALALTGAVLLVSDLLFKSAAATLLVTAATAVFLAWFWYGLPLLRRIEDPGDTPLKRN